MAQTTQHPTKPCPAAALQPRDPSIPPENPYDSPFLTAFLTASPVAAEIISHLSTPQKQYLFATCSALSSYRDSCYAWRSVTLTKYGYEPQTSFANLNYQVQQGIMAQKRYISVPDENTLREKAEKEGWKIQKPVERYFCKELDSAKVWGMFSLRPAFGTVLKELVLDGTSVDMAFVKKILTVCAVSGKGLKRLSVRYCQKINFNDVVEMMPKARVIDEGDDSGFESQSDGEEDEDSLLCGLLEFKIYGIRDLHLANQEHRQWLAKLDQFFKYTNEKKIRSDVGWCSQTLQGPKKRLRRSHCHGTRELPFIRILPLADTGSTRTKKCMGCNKGPEQIGWHCDQCLKDVLCESCGDFLCDNCDPKRSRIVKCGDCPSRKCKSCFKKEGGSFCSKQGCKGKPSCGIHCFDISCNACSETKEITCSSCNPARKCKRCDGWIYSHCEGSYEPFQCGCNFEICHDCCETVKTNFIKADINDDSVEQLVYALDSSDFPIVPKRFEDIKHDKELLLANNNWCCFYCKIMPGREQRFVMNRRDNAAHRGLCSRRTSR
ncbi:hypothetical protein TWF106_001864 [Orbilia oligospora]|uniref:Uncharacterized protein n=1 Tax=Orbilia oligospora TaxID=2813651 RepID=A0A6G1LTT4_ORBOL|nr:hypothetical protein TWF788_010666 [Orbilia oligospora]KAF3203781.1 hypothetical protein TWF106_001864 [Orbilia oligospora]KAF3214185.1 hypothetical protein TWF679_005051 [Orbilia oligospora]KAF3223409.1 hypothetical protein TWF191_006420 [Orbilia oligospora]KAF3233118.1 hypothetical protein TWF192_002530 [Orbilia oligospora]